MEGCSHNAIALLLGRPTIQGIHVRKNRNDRSSSSHEFIMSKHAVKRCCVLAPTPCMSKPQVCSNGSRGTSVKALYEI